MSQFACSYMRYLMMTHMMTYVDLSFCMFANGQVNFIVPQNGKFVLGRHILQLSVCLCVYVTSFRGGVEANGTGWHRGT